MNASPIKVMLVDDSAIIRGLMTRALKEAPDIEIIATAENGQIAIDNLAFAKPDVIILDIEMPVMDGLTALPELIKRSPATHVIMASTLTLRNAEVSMQAIALGATDYLPKPSAKTPDATREFFRDLIEKVRSLGRSPKARPAPQQAVPIQAAPAVSVQPPRPVTAAAPVALQGVRAVAIASSTGGPQALQELFGALKTRLSTVPVFITQHMPPTFTTILADHLAKASGAPCREAKDGEKVVAGTIYVAPGDHHMIAEKQGADIVLRLNQGAPENFCRPAADPMLRSLAAMYGKQLLGVVLTGMGQDGMLGAKDVVAAGGNVIAQDKESCVVWGMPRAVEEAGIARAILPLHAIPEYLAKAVL